MAKAKNSFEKLARQGAERLAMASVHGQQLSLLPEEPGQTPVEAAGGQVGRPKGAKNKVSNQMRDWLASKGYQMPEDVLAQMAGLGGSQDAVMTAMETAERVLTWSFAGQKDKDGNPVLATGAQRMETFLRIFTIKLRAAEALLPYGAPKATPDGPAALAVQINVPGAPAAPAQPGDQARDVTPEPSVKSGRMMPANVAYEMQQNQGVSEGKNSGSDGEDRTE